MKASQRIKDTCAILCKKCAEQYVVLHGNLSRFTGLLIMLNVTLFFVGGAVMAVRDCRRQSRSLASAYP
jgi:hypothetical protein